MTEIWVALVGLMVTQAIILWKLLDVQSKVDVIYHRLRK